MERLKTLYLKKLGKIRKVSKPHRMIDQCSVFLSKCKYCQYQQKILEKLKLNFSLSVLFHMKTLLIIKYFLNGCSLLHSVTYFYQFVTFWDFFSKVFNFLHQFVTFFTSLSLFLTFFQYFFSIFKTFFLTIFDKFLTIFDSFATFCQLNLLLLISFYYVGTFFHINLHVFVFFYQFVSFCYLNFDFYVFYTSLSLFVI